VDPTMRPRWIPRKSAMRSGRLRKTAGCVADFAVDSSRKCREFCPTKEKKISA
jgi:hypothetical protein